MPEALSVICPKHLKKKEEQKAKLTVSISDRTEF
jgi:hypothetical protein